MLPFGRKVGVLGDLGELAFEKCGKLLRVEVTVELNVAYKALRYIFERVTVAESKDLLQILEAFSRGIARYNLWRAVVATKVSSYGAIILLTLDRAPQAVLRCDISRRSPHWAGLIRASSATFFGGSSFSVIEVIGEVGDELVGAFVVSIAP